MIYPLRINFCDLHTLSEDQAESATKVEYFNLNANFDAKLLSFNFISYPRTLLSRECDNRCSMIMIFVFLLSMSLSAFVLLFSGTR